MAGLARGRHKPCCHRRHRCDRRTDVRAPEGYAAKRSERENIVGLGDHDDHRFAARTALDIEGLSVHIAGDAPIEIQVALKPGREGGRKRAIDIQAVARAVVVVLRDIHGFERRTSGNQDGQKAPRQHKRDVDYLTHDGLV